MNPEKAQFEAFGGRGQKPPEGQEKKEPQIEVEKTIFLAREAEEAFSRNDFAAALAKLQELQQVVAPESIANREPSEKLEQAREIFGQDFLGPEAVEKAWGVKLAAKDIPAIPFSREELERARELGQMLILRVAKAVDGQSLTMEKMNELLAGKLSKEGKGKVLYDVGWYKNEDFFKKETPQASWALISKEVIPNSTSKNYLEQTEKIVVYLKNQVFKGQALPKEFQEAIKEFEKHKPEIAEQMSKDWPKAAEALANLKLNQLTRSTPVETLYDLLVDFQNTDQRLLNNKYTWTKGRSSDGRLVGVGFFGSRGAGVVNWRPANADGDLGVSFSRSL